jgi:dienelactone hydrolase
MRHHGVVFLLTVVLSSVGLAACGSGGSTPSAHPANAPFDDVRWYTHSAPSGARVLVGVVRGPTGQHGAPPGVLLVPGTEGLTTDYDTFAHQLAAAGFDVAIGCWFGAAPSAPGDIRIGCAGAPKFKGVSEAAVPDLDALVAAARDVLRSDQLALVGFSRGGGIALLRATHGSTEPVVSIAGMVEGTSGLGYLPGEVNVVPRAAGIHAPVLLLHGGADPVVPVQQATDLEQALRAVGDPVQAKYYPGKGHGLAQDPVTRLDLIHEISSFLCSHLACAPA